MIALYKLEKVMHAEKDRSAFSLTALISAELTEHTCDFFDRSRLTIITQNLIIPDVRKKATKKSTARSVTLLSLAIGVAILRIATLANRKLLLKISKNAIL